MNQTLMPRQEAWNILERQFGLSGPKAYLLDVIPLVEMLWADGRCQEAERVLVAKYLREHVDWLREQAGGIEVVSPEDVDAFLARFVENRPPPELLQALSAFALSQPAVPGMSDPDRRQRLIEYSLDIAAAAVTAYPYGPHERFCESEKAAFLKLAQSLL